MKAVRETAHEGKGNKPRDSGELTEEEQLEQRMIHVKENAIIKPFICMLTQKTKYRHLKKGIVPKVCNKSL